MTGWLYRNPPNSQFRLNRASPLARGLVAWWPMLGSRGANTLRDYSGYGYNGTFATGSNSPAWLADARAGFVLNFDETGPQYVRFGDVLDNDGTTPMTVSIWLRTTDTSGFPIVKQLNTSPFTGWNVQLAASNQFDFNIMADASNDRVQVRSSSGTVTDGLAHLLTAVYDGSRTAAGVQLYVDGRAVSMTTIVDNFDSGSAASSAELEMGARAAAAGQYNGDLQDVYIHHRALSAAEVWQLYAPQTRWQLYEPVVRRVLVGVAAAGGGGVTLTVQDALHAHGADNTVLTQHHALAVADTLHAHAAESPSLTQHNALVVADAAHAHSAETPTLTQHYVLLIADALHAQTVDNVALTQHYALVVADTLHGHAADNAALTQHSILVVAAALHAHAADNVTLSIAGQLTVQDALHAHSVDSVALTQHHALAVQDALHAHVAEMVALTTQLIVQDALHSHSVDALVLGIALIVQDANHAHNAEALVLTQHHALAVADSLHGHNAGNVALDSGIAFIVMALVNMRFTASANVEMRFVAQEEVEL